MSSKIHRITISMWILILILSDNLQGTDELGTGLFGDALDHIWEEAGQRTGSFGDGLTRTPNCQYW